MKHLFIGGTKDGKRIALSESHSYVRLPIRREYGPNEPLEHEEYRRYQFGGEMERFTVFALCGLSADRVLERLIESYPEPTEDRSKELIDRIADAVERAMRKGMCYSYRELQSIIQTAITQHNEESK